MRLALSERLLALGFDGEELEERMHDALDAIVQYREAFARARSLLDHSKAAGARGYSIASTLRDQALRNLELLTEPMPRGGSR